MSEVCWYHVPEDAEFYAEGRFRKRVGDQVMYLDEVNEWGESVYDYDKFLSSADYEKRPVKVNPISTPEATPDVTTEGGTGAIKSDGGSSSYYDIPIPDWLVGLIVERRYIKTEELIEVLGGNFDEGNILKCLVRINSLRNGKGKEGNSVDYDCNKIIYSANRIKEVCSR